MPYITIHTKKQPRQITIEEVLFGIPDDFFTPHRDTADTRTYYVDRVSDDLSRKVNFVEMHKAISAFNEKYRMLIDNPDKQSLYYTFTIPKRSGGLRRIDAPCDELKNALLEFKTILESVFYASYHTSAFAYVKQRCAVDSVRRHQANKSRWFLKLDFSKFFPSTSMEFLTSMLYKTFPLCEYINAGYGYKEDFERALSLCFLNGGLPQGTPVSPLLTNMMMIPVDYEISKMCRGHSPKLMYTRYADDMLISSPYDFQWTDVCASVEKILGDVNAPMQINRKKTRYGSSSGSNWNLGVMLNKDGDITVGHAKKKLLKTKVFQFMTDFAAKNPWNIEDTQQLQGEISYYKMVEGDVIQEIIDKYSEKFGFSVMAAIKDVITS